VGDVIPFPLRGRSVAPSEEPASAMAAALRAARADRLEESRDRLNVAIALGLLRESGGCPLCDVVPIESRS
jgi:hypothetical protein